MLLAILSLEQPSLLGCLNGCHCHTIATSADTLHGSFHVCPGINVSHHIHTIDSLHSGGAVAHRSDNSSGRSHSSQSTIDPASNPQHGAAIIIADISDRMAINVG